MIDQLAAVTTAPGTAGTSWLPFRVKLVDESGKPVVGNVDYRTSAAGAVKFGGGTDDRPFYQSMETDSQGFADFGTVPGGVYDLTVNVAVTDHHEYTRLETLIGPGAQTTSWRLFVPPRYLRREP